MHKFLLVAGLSLTIAACGSSGGGGGGGGELSVSGSDSFIADVQQLSATSPDNSEPVNVDAIAVSTPENTEPENIG